MLVWYEIKAFRYWNAKAAWNDLNLPDAPP